MAAIFGNMYLAPVTFFAKTFFYEKKCEKWSACFAMVQAVTIENDLEEIKVTVSTTLCFEKLTLALLGPAVPTICNR